jgi:hypothetical protein
MENTDKLVLEKVSRKNFLFYTGIVFAGAFMLFKLPFKIFGKKEQEVQSNVNSKDVRFEANPDSVRRS